MSASGVAGLALPRSAYDNLAARLEAEGKLAPLGPWAVVDFEYGRLALHT